MAKTVKKSPTTVRKRTTRSNTKKATASKATRAVAKKPIASKKGKETKQRNEGNQTKYWAYEMTGGKEEYFMSEQDAREFELEFEAIIKKVRKFASKKQFDMRKKEFNRSPAKETPPAKKIDYAGKKGGLSPKDRDRAQRVIDLIAKDRPSNSINVYVKSTKRSRKAAAIIELMDRSNEPIWCAKGNHQAISLKNFGKIFKQESRVIQQALANLTCGKMRDTSGDPYKPKVNVWKSPTNETREYDLFTMWTTFDIPHTKLHSNDEEKEFLLEAGKEIGEQFKDIMTSDIYETCLEQAVNSEAMWRSMNAPRKGPNYKQYIQSCVVKVHMCNNLNTHLVLEDSTLITTALYESSLKTAKYKTIDVQRIIDMDEDAVDSEPESDNVTNNGATLDESEESSGENNGKNNEDFIVQPEEKESDDESIGNHHEKEETKPDKTGETESNMEMEQHDDDE